MDTPQFNPTSAAIAGGTSLLDFGLGLFSSAQQRSHDYEMLKRNQEFAEKMWNMNNEYNSPVNVLKRAKEAGINPTAALGHNFSPAQAVSANGGASALPQLQGLASAGATNAMSFLSQLVQNENVTASTQKTKEETKQVGQQIRINEAMLQPTLNKIIADTKVSNQTAHQLRALTPLLLGKTENEIKLIVEQVEEVKARVSLTGKQGENVVVDTKLKNTEQQLRNCELQLAKQGIFVSADGLSNLLHILASDNGDVVGKIISRLGDVIGEQVEKATDVVAKPVRTMTNPRNLKKALRKILPPYNIGNR